MWQVPNVAKASASFQLCKQQTFTRIRKAMSSTRQRNIRTKRATSEEPSEQEQAGPSGAIEECLRQVPC